MMPDWVPHWIPIFLAGLFVGCFMGLVLSGLCRIAGEHSRRLERERLYGRNWCGR